jgi:hypothetical protein
MAMVLFMVIEPWRYAVILFTVIVLWLFVSYPNPFRTNHLTKARVTNGYLEHGAGATGTSSVPGAISSGQGRRVSQTVSTLSSPVADAQGAKSSEGSDGFDASAQVVSVLTSDVLTTESDVSTRSNSSNSTKAAAATATTMTTTPAIASEKKTLGGKKAGHIKILSSFYIVVTVMDQNSKQKLVTESKQVTVTSSSTTITQISFSAVCKCGHMSLDE